MFIAYENPLLMLIIYVTGREKGIKGCGRERGGDKGVWQGEGIKGCGRERGGIKGCGRERGGIKGCGRERGGDKGVW